MKKLIIFLIFFCFNLSAQDGETTKWVATWGDDTNGTGESSKPFKTINKALSVLDSGTIMFRATEFVNTYREEVVIDGKENITIRGYEAGNLGNRYIIFDGTTDLSEYNWTNQGGNIFKTTIDTAIWQLFVEGNEMVMARWPNAQFSDKSIYSWDTWAEGDETNSINGMLVIDNTKSFYSGLDYTLDTAHAILNIGSFRTWNRKIQYSEGSDFFTYNNVPNSQYKDKHHYFFVEGDLNLLDTLNEWYHNPKTGELWLKTDGTNPNDLEVKGKTSTYSFDIKNSKNITIENLFFFS